MLFMVAVGGVLMLMVAKGHYSIDVVSSVCVGGKLDGNEYNVLGQIIAYFVTTRLWYILHSIINNRQLQNRSSANFLSRSVQYGHAFISQYLILQTLVVETDCVV